MFDAITSKIFLYALIFIRYFQSFLFYSYATLKAYFIRPPYFDHQILSSFATFRFYQTHLFAPHEKLSCRHKLASATFKVFLPGIPVFFSRRVLISKEIHLSSLLSSSRTLCFLPTFSNHFFLTYIVFRYFKCVLCPNSILLFRHVRSIPFQPIYFLSFLSKLFFLGSLCFLPLFSKRSLLAFFVFLLHLKGDICPPILSLSVTFQAFLVNVFLILSPLSSHSLSTYFFSLLSKPHLPNYFLLFCHFQSGLCRCIFRVRILSKHSLSTNSFKTFVSTYFYCSTTY